MITLDTSAVLALLNGADKHHDLILRSRNAEARPWYVPSTVLAEIGYLVESELGVSTLDAFLRDLEREAYLLTCGEPDLI